MKQLFVIAALLLALLPLAGCGPQPAADVEATVAAAVVATQDAAPTPTALPTHTPLPTATATPTPLPTATATPTPEPTATAAPTGTPLVAGPGEMIETELETGDVRYELPAAGFSLTLPRSWYAVDLNRFSFAEVLEAAGAESGNNERLRALFSSDYFQQLTEGGMKFYAVNVDADNMRGLNPPTINVVRQELALDMPLAQYATLVKAQLAELFDLTGDVELTLVTVGEEEAARLAYTVEIVTALGQSLESAHVQYLFLGDGSYTVVTLSLPAEGAEERMQAYEAALESFRFIE